MSIKKLERMVEQFDGNWCDIMDELIKKIRAQADEIDDLKQIIENFNDCAIKSNIDPLKVDTEGFYAPPGLAACSQFIPDQCRCVGRRPIADVGKLCDVCGKKIA